MTKFALIATVALFTGVCADQGATRFNNCCTQLNTFGSLDRFNIGFPHTPGGAGYCNSDHSDFLVLSPVE